MVHGPNHWKHTFTWLVMAWTWEESFTFSLVHNIDYKWWGKQHQKWHTFSRLLSKGLKIAKIWLLLYSRFITPSYMDFYLKYFKGKTIALKKKLSIDTPLWRVHFDPFIERFNNWEFNYFFASLPFNWPYNLCFKSSNGECDPFLIYNFQNFF